MKIIYTFLTLLCIALFSISCNTHKHNTENVKNSKIFYEPEQQPYYLRGGEQGLLNDLYTIILKTAPEIQDSISRRAVVRFTINKHGLIDHNSIKVIRNRSSVPDDYMNAAIEAIKHLGKFEPGRINGIPVSVRYNLPIIYPVPAKFIRTE